MSGSQGEERGGSKAIFCTMSRKVKQANNTGNNDKHFWGSREGRKNFSGSREHELKTFLGTRGFINREQGIKSKNIKGSQEHVPHPPPPPWDGLTSINPTISISKNKMLLSVEIYCLLISHEKK